jgi:purine-binding chemotaxis protein CheW
MNIAAADIEAAPDFGARLQTDYILGMAKVRETVKTILDIDRVVSIETLEAVTAESTSAITA